MEKAFDETTLRREFSKMEFWKQLVFLFAISQRLLPSFVFFARESKLSGVELLESAMHKAYELLNAGVSNADLTEYASRCEAIAPDTEDYDSIFVSSALDAAVAVSLLMKAFTNNKTSFVIEGASLAIDSVDMYVQELDDMDPNCPDIEQMILNHRLMQLELKRQRLDLELLANLSDDQFISMKVIADKLINQGESCLDLQT
ncbi:DUF416 family protein [Microbulbifer sp. ZKSA004]|uniref:DUF416 family protein n=1 Tax=Microbulbifer sp. ZKSA004 TaxID=3243389 RepID=UPI0040398E79